MPEMMWEDDDTLVDETEAEPSIEERKAARFVEACQCFVEALLSISEACGPDHEDTTERAILAIRHMQKTAHDALLAYGFTPKRELVE
jgi:hypothetical protein